MKISIIGSGYVGLVSGACLASVGHQVICVDMDEDRVRTINNGVAPIHEDGLDELLSNPPGQPLVATTDLASAVEQTEVSMVAVGTPFDGQNIDLGQIENAAAQIGQAIRTLDRYHTVIVKSTVVPGTTDGIVREILERESGKTAGKDFGLGMNPEFLREGSAVGDFMHPDRIVLGGVNEHSIALQREIYAPFGDVDRVETNNRTAEMIKYTANSLLATMISFSNEMANLCSVLPGVDVAEVLHGVKLDRRLSPIAEDGVRLSPGFNDYLEAGCGFGGSCFPKDVKALAAFGQQMGQPMSILEAVIQINNLQPLEVLKILKDKLNGVAGKKITVLGLAFKPGTDDLRESPSIPLTNELLAAGTHITAFDPEVEKSACDHLIDGEFQMMDSLEQSVSDADAVVLMTRWPEFRKLPAILAAINPGALLLDGRRMLHKEDHPNYAGIGIGKEININDASTATKGAQK